MSNKFKFLVVFNVNSRLCVLGEPHIWEGGKFDAFFNFWCVLGDILGEIWDSRGGSPTPEDSWN